jgi:hypothetical protein
MRTEQQRDDAYSAKIAPTTVGLKVAAVLSGMKTGFAAAITSIVPIEQQVQGLLNGYGDVPTIQYPFYLNFAREIWGMRNRGIDGDSLEAMAQSLHDKYESYGLATLHLIDIADVVFNVTVT